MDDFISLIRTAVRIDEPIDSQTPLISSGFIDSFDVVALLAVFERQYGVAIAPDQVDVETFDTPRQMLTRIEALRH